MSHEPTMEAIHVRTPDTQELVAKAKNAVAEIYRAKDAIIGVMALYADAQTALQYALYRNAHADLSADERDQFQHLRRVIIASSPQELQGSLLLVDRLADSIIQAEWHRHRSPAPPSQQHEPSR